MSTIMLQFDTNQKLKQIFPKDPLGDIIINFQNEEFVLQRQYLEPHSEYFKRLFKPAYHIQQISIQNQNIDPILFKSVLSLIYGHQIQISIEKVNMYLKIFRFLEMNLSIKEMDQQYYNVLFNLEFNDLFKVLDFLFISNSKKAQQRYIERIIASTSLDCKLIEELPIQDLSMPSFSKFLPQLYIQLINYYDQTQYRQEIQNFIMKTIEIFCQKQFQNDVTLRTLKQNEFKSYFEKDLKNCLKNIDNHGINQTPSQQKNNNQAPSQSKNNNNQNNLNNLQSSQNGSFNGSQDSELKKKMDKLSSDIGYIKNVLQKQRSGNQYNGQNSGINSQTLQNNKNSNIVNNLNNKNPSEQQVITQFENLNESFPILSSAITKNQQFQHNSQQSSSQQIIQQEDFKDVASIVSVQNQSQTFYNSQIQKQSQNTNIINNNNSCSQNYNSGGGGGVANSSKQNQKNWNKQQNQEDNLNQGMKNNQLNKKKQSEENNNNKRNNNNNSSQMGDLSSWRNKLPTKSFQQLEEFLNTELEFKQQNLYEALFRKLRQQYQDFDFQIIFEQKKNSFNLKNFDEKVQNKKNLIFIFKSKNFDNVFGCFIHAPIEQNKKIFDDNSFLFKLNGFYYHNIQKGHQAFFYNDSLLNFGDSDIVIQNDANSNQCQENFPKNYQLVLKQNQDNYFLSGGREFFLSNFIVIQLITNK